MSKLLLYVAETYHPQKTDADIVLKNEITTTITKNNVR